MKKFALALGALMLFAAPAFAEAGKCQTIDQASESLKPATEIERFTTKLEMDKIVQWAQEQDHSAGTRDEYPFTEVVVYTSKVPGTVFIAMFKDNCFYGGLGYNAERAKRMSVFVRGEAIK